MTRREAAPGTWASDGPIRRIPCSTTRCRTTPATSGAAGRPCGGQTHPRSLSTADPLMCPRPQASTGLCRPLSPVHGRPGARQGSAVAPSILGRRRDPVPRRRRTSTGDRFLPRAPDDRFRRSRNGVPPDGWRIGRRRRIQRAHPSGGTHHLRQTSHAGTTNPNDFDGIPLRQQRASLRRRLSWALPDRRGPVGATGLRRSRPALPARQGRRG